MAGVEGGQAFGDEEASAAAAAGGGRVGKPGPSSSTVKTSSARRCPPRAGRAGGVAAGVLHRVVEDVADEVAVEGHSSATVQFTEVDAVAGQVLVLGQPDFGQIADHRRNDRQGGAVAQQAVGGQGAGGRPAAASMA